MMMLEMKEEMEIKEEMEMKEIEVGDKNYLYRYLAAAVNYI
jgi:hypothetical protein